MEKNRIDLKARFQKGDKPTENDYADIFDSFVHKSEDIYVQALPDAQIGTRGIVAQASSNEAKAGTNNSKFITPLGAQKAVETFSPVTSVNNSKGDVVIPNYQDDITTWEALVLENANAGATSPEYIRKTGIVFLRGEITMSTENTLFLLPNDFRPNTATAFYVSGSDNTSFRIEIKNDGIASCESPIDGTTISLSSIHFLSF